jgi:penicillin amidase
VRRLATYVLAFIAVFLLATLSLAVWYRHAALPRIAGDVRLKGLHGTVFVSRDSLGIPTITAGDEHDLVFAQGYVHAQDRLWQMEMMRHVGSGTLSEMFGERTIATDRFLRVFGVPRAAALQDSVLDDTSRTMLQAYADGVNAYIDEGHPLPPEYQILRIKPGHWTVRQSLAVEKVMALDLSQYFLALNRTRAVRRLGIARAAALQPKYPSWGPVILEDSPAKAAMDSTVIPDVPPIAVQAIAAGSITHASNAWVIGGARTASHKPILANDMHLELSAPPIWYLVALHIDGAEGAGGAGGAGRANRTADDAHVAGMSLPGSPYVVAGHNRAIAWGLTNVMLDDADFFIERIDAADSSRYMTPDGPAQFLYATDSIRVKGRRTPEILKYRITRHGPVISDVEPGIATGRDVIALQWLGAQPSHTMGAPRAFMRATSWQEFKDAVALFDDPHQNVVYADTAGHIGYQMGGRVPDRGGKLPPSLPVPGWTGEWDWRGFIPFERHPSVFDPAQGYVVTANNRQAAGGIADLISDGWETPFRAARIRDMILTAKRRVTADDVHRMQLDTHDGTAERYRDRAIAAARAAGQNDAAEILQKWNGSASRNEKGATLFYFFYDRLRYHLVRSLYGSDAGWMDRAIVDEALEHRAVAWPAAKTGAVVSYDSIARIAMNDAVRLANGRTWGDAHHITALHQMGSVAILQRLLHLNIGAQAGDGSPTTVNVSWSSGPISEGSNRNAMFNATLGPSQRHVVDLGDIDGAGGFILPGGQSGIPFSPHYADQWLHWLDGGLARVAVNASQQKSVSQRNSSRKQTSHTLKLMPAE